MAMMGCSSYSFHSPACILWLLCLSAFMFDNFEGSVLGDPIAIANANANTNRNLRRAVSKDSIQARTARRRGRSSFRKLSNDDNTPQIIHRTMGEKELLVIRIEGKDGSSTTASTEQLIDDIFHDDTNVSTQFAACSRNQFVLKPARGSPNIQNGVITVELDEVAGLVATEIFQTIELLSQNTDQFGRHLQDFDQVMICMPPGVQTELQDDRWVAFVPSLIPYRNYLAIFHDDWCSSVSAGMHEIGHTLGLQHSGKSFSESSYDDATGQMGFVHKSESGPQKCFNPAKSWQLGWYADQSLRFDPLLDNTPFSTVLTGITRDPNDADPQTHVLLQIPNEANDDLYIGYNRQESFNSGTEEGQDLLLVNLQEAGGLKESKLMAELDTNESYRIPNFRGIAGTTLVITMKDRISDSDEALVEISLEQDTAPLSEGCSGDNQVRFEATVFTDDYPEDTSWTLTKDETGEIVASRSEGSFFEPSSSNVDWVCLDRDGSSYTFKFSDVYQDGICCDNGFGGYSGYLGGKELFRGGEFRNTPSVEHSFVVSDTPAVPPPTFAPTPSRPTATPTASRGECEDDPAYLFSNKPGRDCQWVGYNEFRRQQKCNQNDPNTTLRVAHHCPSVCLNACQSKRK